MLYKIHIFYIAAFKNQDHYALLSSNKNKTLRDEIIRQKNLHVSQVFQDM